MNAVLHYDFTLQVGASADGKETASPSDISDAVCALARAFAFQKEIGELTHRVHFQGRFTLKEKMRMQTLINKLKGTVLEGCHLSPTSRANMGNMFYVMKEGSRVDGPWTDKDLAQVVPMRFRDFSPWRWQAKLIEIARENDDRTVHVVYDAHGNIGKSTLCGYMATHGMARMIPPMKDHKDIMRMAMCAGEARCYLVDLPRAMDKERLISMWTAIESLKNGHVYDDRYEYKEKWFIHPPTVIVFTNKIPDRNILSADRWAIWTVANGDLLPYE